MCARSFFVQSLCIMNPVTSPTIARIAAELRNAGGPRRFSPARDKENIPNSTMPSTPIPLLPGQSARRIVSTTPTRPRLNANGPSGMQQTPTRLSTQRALPLTPLRSIESEFPKSLRKLEIEEAQVSAKVRRNRDSSHFSEAAKEISASSFCTGTEEIEDERNIGERSRKVSTIRLSGARSRD